MILTGHSARIGKHLHAAWPNAIGMSRSNGWNISETSRIVEAAAQHDIFINCAHGQGFQQTTLMMALFDAYRNSDKLFITIGTDAAYSSKWAVVYEQYPIEKSALHAAIEHLQNLSHRCRITLIEPNDIKDFSLDKISNAVQFVIDNPDLEIKNIRFQGRQNG